MSQCVLYDRRCINCGECNMCDIDPDKVCDNCGKCIKDDRDYAEITITGVIMDDSDEFLSKVPDHK